MQSIVRMHRSMGRMALPYREHHNYRFASTLVLAGRFILHYLILIYYGRILGERPI